MTRTKLPEEKPQKKRDILHVRLDEQSKEQLKAMAEQSGQSLSEVARAIIQDCLDSTVQSEKNLEAETRLLRQLMVIQQFTGFIARQIAESSLDSKVAHLLFDGLTRIERRLEQIADEH